MVKKISHSNTLSPQKHLLPLKPHMSSLHGQHKTNSHNILPLSNDLKKSNKQGQNGSTQTQDNPQVEEQRRQTTINQFELSLIPSDDISPPAIGASSGFGMDGSFGMGGSGDSGDSGDDENGSNGGSGKKDTEYLKFFKFYYEKTKTEHPNWTPSQITKIVSLLWKKKKNIDKVPSKANSTTSRKSSKPVAAKDAFRMKHKELSREEVDELWSKLPQQSKNFWKKEGNSYGNVSAKSSDVSSVKNCKNTGPMYNSMRVLLQNC